MNFGGHIEVARRLDPSWFGGPSANGGVGYLLGSALPDIASMGRFRLTGRGDDPSVAAGIDLHHRTDDVFHRHRWFRETSGAVTAKLRQDGLGLGPAMACGHVGVELLLDGHLLRTRPGLKGAMDNAMRSVGSGSFDLSDLVADDRRQEWGEHLERVATFDLPIDYDAPNEVAALLHRILKRRSRLAFDADLIDVVTDGLEHHLSDIRNGAAELLEDLHRDLETELANRQS